MRYVIAGLFGWLVLNGLFFVHSWSSGRTSAKHALRLVRDINLFVMSGAIAFGALVFLLSRI
jgi:hypothetical protein